MEAAAGRKGRERWMDGCEMCGGQIGPGDKGTAAVRVASRLAVEWPLQAPPWRPTLPLPQNTAGRMRWSRRWTTDS